MINKIINLIIGNKIISFCSILFVLYCLYILNKNLIREIRKNRVRYYKYDAFFDIDLNVLCPYCFSRLKNRTKNNHIAIYYCRKCKKYLYLKNGIRYLTVNAAIAGIKNDKDAKFIFGVDNDNYSQSNKSSENSNL